MHEQPEKTDQIADAIRAALAARNTNPRRAAIEAGLPENAIRTVLQGHPPNADRLREIAEALGLEFYFGPPRTDTPKIMTVSEEEMERLNLWAANSRSLTERIVQVAGELIDRKTMEIGGNISP